jgi:hypothetical protein
MMSARIGDSGQQFPSTRYHMLFIPRESFVPQAGQQLKDIAIVED